MTQTVYADLYFIVNTGMDLLCLLITSALLHRRASRWRLILSAALGGIYALLSLLLGVGGIWGILPDLVAAFFICTLAFWQKNTKRTHLWLGRLKNTGVFVLVSALMGGVMTALYSLLNRLSIPFPALEGDGISAWLFLAVSLLSALFTAKGSRLFALWGRQKTVTLHLSLYGKKLELTALVDTGNLLTDPISGKSVIAVDPEKLMPLLPPALCNALRDRDPAGWFSSPERARGARLIHAQTAAGDTLLLALTPDSLFITRGTETLACNHLIAPAPLGDHARGFDAVIGLFS